ncbi:MAG: amino acid ABC transporter permease, partial [Rhodobacteraceae bacterium]|nr:amino acid ABC transporter permease [Paracoccaceae bacterium]
MHYKDNIDYPPMLTRPVVFVPLLSAIFAGLWWFQSGDGAFGRLVRGLAPVAEGNPLNLVTAACVTALVGFNIFVVMRLPLRQQVWLVWGELAALILLFFYSFDLSFAFIQRKIGFLITQGLLTTLYISAASIAIATVLALMGAIAKLSSNGIAQGIAHFYTSLFRGLPLLMQIYMIYLGLPQLGYVVDAVPTGIAALSLCYGAYMTEIFRAGIESIPRGQWEAARALGMRPVAVMTRIILPQSMRVIIPPTGNQFISML